MTRPQPIFPQASPIEADTPLRLDVAAELGFPDGGMTAKGLRREASRGRLVIERVAGKDYTTLAHIQRMRELCRLAVKVQDSGSAPSGETAEAVSLTPASGSSATEATKRARDAALTIAKGLSAGCKPTSHASTSTARHKGNVVPIRSR